MAKSYFSPKETRCKCGQCSADISQEMRQVASLIRHLVGKPLSVTSGARCEAHNAKIGGARFSQHRLGNAIDLKRTPELEQVMGDILALIAGAEATGVDLGALMRLRMEDPTHTPTWIHIDLGHKPGMSRVFKP